MSGRDTPRSEAPLTGRCHCGNLELALETSVRPEALSLRLNDSALPGLTTLLVGAIRGLDLSKLLSGGDTWEVA